MSQERDKAPEYGNWVSKRLLYGSGILGFIFLCLIVVHWGFAVPAMFFGFWLCYFLYARRVFSPRGGNLQNRIRKLVPEYLSWDGDGKALDIGCGNGPLVVHLAQRFPDAEITGIDYWQGMWDYSQKSCEENAQLEGVAERTAFQNASASNLPFEDGQFDAVVSNFVFHEVTDTKDKVDLIEEALRVLKPGGEFSFQDLFLVKQYYGSPEELVARVRDLGVEEVELVRTNELDFIPNAMKLPFMVGQICILHGRK